MYLPLVGGSARRRRVAQTVRPERIIIVDDGSDDHASVEMLNAILDDCRHRAMDTNGVAIDLIGQANAGLSAASRGSAAAATTSRCAAASRTGISSCRCWSADWLRKATPGKARLISASPPEPLVEYRTAPASSNVTSMTKRLDLMRFLINKHCDLYAAHLADAILGVEAISMSRLAMWESLMRGDTTVSQAFMTHPTYGDGGMAAAVRLRS